MNRLLAISLAVLRKREFVLTFLIAVVGLMPFSFASAQTSGIFGTGVVIQNNGTLTVYEATLLGDGRHAPIPPTVPPVLDATGFEGLDLGTFNPAIGDTLTLGGGEMLTFKNSGDDVSATRINWSLDGGVFTPIGLIFNENDVSGNVGDQRWYAEGPPVVDLLSGASVGSHTLAVFFDADTAFQGTIFESNGGNDFTATFNVVPEPAAIFLLASGALMLLLRPFRRRR